MALTHLFDTSVLIDPPVDDPGSGSVVGTGVICLGELHAGLLLASTPKRRAGRHAPLTTVVERFVALDVDRDVAATYGELRAANGQKPSADLWIAATARAHGLVLVARDQKLARLEGIVAQLA